VPPPIASAKPTKSPMRPSLPAGSRKCCDTRPRAAVPKRPSGRSRSPRIDRSTRIDGSTITSPATRPRTQISPGARGTTAPTATTEPHNHSPPTLTTAPVQISSTSRLRSCCGPSRRSRAATATPSFPSSRPSARLALAGLDAQSDQPLRPIRGSLRCAQWARGADRNGERRRVRRMGRRSARASPGPASSVRPGEPGTIFRFADDVHPSCRDARRAGSGIRMKTADQGPVVVVRLTGNGWSRSCCAAAPAARARCPAGPGSSGPAGVFRVLRALTELEAREMVAAVVELHV
jgi:hypothetical protein